MSGRAQGSGGAGVGGRTRAAVAVMMAASLLLSAGLAAPTFASNPPDEEKRPASGSKSAGPRKTSLGGAKSKAPPPMKELGGVKVPNPRIPKATRHPGIQLGGVPSRGARPMTGLNRGIGKFPVPEEAERAPARQREPQPELTMEQRRAVLLGAPPSAAMGRAAKDNNIDVEVGPRVRHRPDDDGSRSLEAAREAYGGLGYREVRVAPGEVVFVKPASDADMRRFEESAEKIRQSANTYEQQDRFRREWSLRRMEDRERRNEGGCAGGVCGAGSPSFGIVHAAPAGMLIDPFVRWGGDDPWGAEPEPGLDAAAAALQSGDFSAAATEYMWHLARDPEDVAARRMAALALLLDGQTQLGIDTLATAYSTQPSLASEPIEEGALSRRAPALRRAVQAVVQIGHRTKSAEAWLAAAFLMHVEGRDETASRMLARAAEAGLSGEIVREMELLLGPERP